MFYNNDRAGFLEDVLLQMGRRGRRRHGGFGRGRHGLGRGLMGGHGIPRGRRLGSDELQLVILSLLAEQPAHGYEVMRTLEERSGGFYTPSPGMVYPALTFLEETGQAAVAQDANRKLYSITESGRAHLEANREQVASILEILKRIGGRMADVRDAYAGLGDVDPEAFDELSKARHALKHALMRKRGCGPEELRRIAGLLEGVAAEILKGSRA